MAVAAHSLRTRRPRNVAGGVLSLAAAVAVLYFGRAFFITLISAVVIAFLLDPFVAMLGRLRVPRATASFLVCALALLVVYLVGLGLYTQVADLVEDLPKYQQRVNDLVDRVLARVESIEQSVYALVVPKRFREQEKAEQPPPPPPRSSRRNRTAPQLVVPPVQEIRIRQERPPLISYLAARLGSFYEAALMASFVPFLVYFMLSWQEHFRRRFLDLFDETARAVVARALAGVARIVRAFMIGNFILGLLLTAATALLFRAFWLPYPVLMGSISGFLSLIPYIGLPLAILPAILSALPVYNAMTPYLLLGGAVALFHLIALNLLYPKLVGVRVHLNPLVVTIALMAWSVLWGAMGLILAIPLTAAIKAVCDNVPRLAPYGRLLGD
ncbi:MAG: AI-2E family transporter [Bryobacteraceae bacterium]